MLPFFLVLHPQSGLLSALRSFSYSAATLVEQDVQRIPVSSLHFSQLVFTQYGRCPAFVGVSCRRVSGEKVLHTATGACLAVVYSDLVHSRTNGLGTRTFRIHQARS